MQLTRQMDGGAWRHLVVKVGKSVAATFRCVESGYMKVHKHHCGFKCNFGLFFSR